MRRRLVVLALVLLVGGGLIWLLLGSDRLDVARVDVAGASSETEPLVRDAAAVPAGTSLVWLDTADVAGRVEAIPRVATVDVRRSLPGTLRVSVTERVPVVAVPAPSAPATPAAPTGPADPSAAAAGPVSLVDGTGLAYRSIGAAPAGVPLLRLPAGVTPSPGDPSTAAAVRVVTALPPALRTEVREVRAAGPFDVGLTLADGRVVRWGGDAENDRKAAVLAALLSRPGRTYDVSTPELAVVS